MPNDMSCGKPIHGLGIVESAVVSAPMTAIRQHALPPVPDAVAWREVIANEQIIELRLGQCQRVAVEPVQPGKVLSLDTLVKKPAARG